MDKGHKQFYEKMYAADYYSPSVSAENHSSYKSLKNFVESCDLSDKYCLEVGSGRGAFQSLVSSYFGIDISLVSGRFAHKNFSNASADSIPFKDSVFDGVWTIAVLEHVPKLEEALEEIWRILRPGGYLYLAPAWNCRPWAAEGYPVRPYSDFNWWGKIIKFSIIIRNNLVFRSLITFPKRFISLIKFWLSKEPIEIRYRKLNPNFEVFWMSDSDAVNSIDPFDAYLWFKMRGGESLNYRTIFKAFFIRHGPIIIQKRKLNEIPG